MASLGFPFKYTWTKHIFEQDLAGRPLPQLLVHALCTKDAQDGGSSSQPCSEGGLEAFGAQGGGPGSSAVLWSLLSHSVHLTGALQLRAR